MVKRLLITGGSGFIGSNLIEYLKDEYEIYSYDAHFPGFGNHIPKSLQIPGDVRDLNQLEFATKNIDCIIHLAALSHVKTCWENPKLCININGGGTLNVLEACRKNDVKKIIIAASDHIYGKNPIQLPINEMHPMNALYESDPYGKSKALQYLFAKMYYDLYGMNIVITASGNVYGGNQSRPNVIPNFKYNLEHNEDLVIHGNGKQTRDFYHVSELCEGYRLCIENEHLRGELINFGSGIETSVNKIAETMMKLYPQSKSKIIHVEDTKLNAMNRMVLDAQKAKKILGWESKISLEDGLKMVVNGEIK